MKLYRNYLSMLLKSQMQYKASFFMTAVGQFLVSFTAFLSLYFMFSRFHSVNGFALSEVLICFSVMLTSFSVTECFAELSKIWALTRYFSVRITLPAIPLCMLAEC